LFLLELAIVRCELTLTDVVVPQAPMHTHTGAHSHSHHRDHAPAFGPRFALAVALNLGFVAIEAGAGIFANSTALLADAGHNLSDVLGLAVAWIGHALAQRPPTQRFTYGLRGSSILAALANAVFLMIAVGAIGWEALRRFAAPEPVAEAWVMGVAAAGVVVNGATAILFAAGRSHDINIRGAFLHMVADAAVSAGVIVAAALILVTGWLWLDPAASLGIVAVIVIGTWGLLRESVNMSLAAVPASVRLDDVQTFLTSQKGVAGVHDLHVWPMSTTETALTAHLVMPAGHPGDRFLMDLATSLREKFSIAHPTIQIEIEAATDCPFAPGHVV
jgi:cobalt-zinc-cadmium efflux system protein